ncbi:MAG: folate-binding protein YgfZ [Kordiimonadaceae bacterium]|nr:folate-binding protein YgfZ [Kordiimonadaceae bacterium]
MIEIHKNRAIITLSGPERRSLLQGIITNDIERLNSEAAIYSALLTPQGKFLYDFILSEQDNTIYMDCEAQFQSALLQKLMMYRLRKDVEILDKSEQFHIITSVDPLNEYNLSFSDPRLSDLGYRAIIESIPAGSDDKPYHMRRIKLGIPEGTHDFIMDKSTILEGHFEELNGVDFKKGCYVGQEVTARMKYRGKVKKQMFPVSLSGQAPNFGSLIMDENGNKIGDLRSSCDKNAIALFNMEKMAFGKEYGCCDIKVTPFMPGFLKEKRHE